MNFVLEIKIILILFQFFQIINRKIKHHFDCLEETCIKN